MASRTSGPRRLLRRIIVFGGAVSAITALRAVLLARNEKRYADVIADPRRTNVH